MELIQLQDRMNEKSEKIPEDARMNKAAFNVKLQLAI